MSRSKLTLIIGAVFFMVGALIFVIALFTEFGNKSQLGLLGTAAVAISMVMIILGTYFKTLENKEEFNKRK